MTQPQRVKTADEIARAKDDGLSFLVREVTTSRHVTYMPVSDVAVLDGRPVFILIGKSIPQQLEGFQTLWAVPWGIKELERIAPK